MPQSKMMEKSDVMCATASSHDADLVPPTWTVVIPGGVVQNGSINKGVNSRRSAVKIIDEK